METQTQTAVTVETVVNAPIEKVWECWTEPRHITRWCQASDDWHAPHAENDLRENGKFKTTMAAKDGSVSFDFEGIYSKVDKLQVIDYMMTDGRKVTVRFWPEGNKTRIKQTFETENTNPVEMQRQGWQAILDNFQRYTEATL
jgi:uncharacterized protein YndB with AHSA1/START domain